MSEEYVQLTEQLALIKAQEEAIKEKLAASRDQVRTGLIDSVRAHIAQYGFEVEDIASALLPKSRAKRASAQKGGTRTTKPATVYRDNATGNTYSKGRIPDWLRAGMLTQQLNPDEKGSLKEYKEKFMTAVVPEAVAVPEVAQAA
jgi:DNA-binding protein H-NS